MYDESYPDENDEKFREIFVHILTAVCTILSVIGVFSGSAVCREIQTKKSTLYHRFLPFLTSQIYNLVWFYYGLLKLDWTIIVSHTIGCTMQTFYMIVYIQYANPVPLVHICAAWTILFLGWFHLNIIIGSRDKVISRLGFIGALSLGLNYLASIIDFIALECTKRQYYNSKLYTANLLNEQVKNQGTSASASANSKLRTDAYDYDDDGSGSNHDIDHESTSLITSFEQDQNQSFEAWSISMSKNKSETVNNKNETAPILQKLSDKDCEKAKLSIGEGAESLSEYFKQQKEFDQAISLKSQQLKSSLNKNDKNLLSPSEEKAFLLPISNIKLPKLDLTKLSNLTSKFTNKLKTFESYTFDSNEFDISQQSQQNSQNLASLSSPSGNCLSINVETQKNVKSQLCNQISSNFGHHHQNNQTRHRSSNSESKAVQVSDSLLGNQSNFDDQDSRADKKLLGVGGHGANAHCTGTGNPSRKSTWLKAHGYSQDYPEKTIFEKYNSNSKIKRIKLLPIIGPILTLTEFAISAALTCSYLIIYILISNTSLILSIIWEKSLNILPLLTSSMWTIYGYIMDDYFVITPYAFGLVCELLKLLYAIVNSDLGFKTLVKVSKLVVFLSRMFQNLTGVYQDLPGGRNREAAADRHERDSQQTAQVRSRVSSQREFDKSGK